MLAQREIQTNEDAKAAAQAIAALGCEAVLVKGGHLGGALATDVLYFGGEWHFFEAERIDTQNTHGTGCTYSAAIATQLAHGKELTEADLRGEGVYHERHPSCIRYRAWTWSDESFLWHCVMGACPPLCLWVREGQALALRAL